MAVQKTDKDEATGQAEETNDRTYCVVDLGTQSRKRIRRLKRGRGKLMGKIENILEDVSSEGVVPAGASAVVVIVKQKASLGSIFDDDD